MLCIADTTDAYLSAIVKSVTSDDAITVGDYFATGRDTDGRAYAENQYFRVQFIDVYYPISYFATDTFGGGRVIVGSGTPSDYGFRYVNLSEGSFGGNDYYVGKGLQITLKSATMNRYFYATVGITDSVGKPIAGEVGGARIAIRVANTGPAAYKSSDGKVVTYGNSAISNAYSTYEYDPDNADLTARVNTPTVTYKIPLGASVIITPYDFAYDTQLSDALRASSVAMPSNGFTLNGFSGSYSATDGAFKIGTEPGNGEESFTGMFDVQYGTGDYLQAVTRALNAANRTNTVGAVSNVANGTDFGVKIDENQPVYNDRLFFARSTLSTDAFTFNPTSFNNFAVSSSNGAGFITQSYGSKIVAGGMPYAVDFMKVTAIQRTTSPAIINLTVCDRYGDSIDGSGSFVVRVVIEVVNTKPHIANPSYYKELAAAPVTSGDEVITEKTFIFSPNGNAGNKGLMADHDGDVPEFVTIRGALVANTRAIADIINIESFDEVLVEHPEYFTDKDGNPLTDYMTATVASSKELVVTALSSTKAIETGVFVYFFVNDRNGGISVGYVQIEVINTAPRLNTSDVDGFDAENPLWSIISTSETDIQRDRYIVGAESTKALVKSKLAPTAIDDDIKLLATDDDTRQAKVVLSQCQVDSTEGHRYINLDMSALAGDDTLKRSAFERAVPSVKTSGQSDFTGAPAAVVVFTRSASGTTPGAPVANYRSELMFYVGGDHWLTRTQLIDALVSTYDGNMASIDDYFDAEGRFIVSDWALVLGSPAGYEAGEQCGIRLSVRDQAELGGDDAGKKTGYNSNRDKKTDDVLDNRVTVDGRLSVTVYQFISQTGLMSINDFLGKNDSYYTVEYNGKNYVPTYDGLTDSVYGADDNTAAIKFEERGSDRYLVYPGDAGYAAANVIKTRTNDSGAAIADGTKAGTNAGVEYTAGTRVNGAFTYSDVIEIPSETVKTFSADNEHPEYAPVYVPMSYFGLMQTLATAASENDQGTPVGTVLYSEEFVGYDMGNYDTILSLGDITKIASAITVSDGNRNWSGAELNENPYIDVSAFYYKGGSDNSEHLFIADGNSGYSRPYYNNRLAVRTVDKDGKLYGYEKVEGNRANFIGDGELMYLAEQAQKLTEHNFGLRFTKKHERTGVNNLTLTINLAKSRGNKNVAPDVNAGETEADVKRTVTVKIHIQNSAVDLYDAPVNSSDSAVKFDGNTYYVDVEMSSSDSATFALSRKSKKDNSVETLAGYASAVKIPYFDDDYSSETYRDYAYFASDSLNQLDRWNIGEQAYKRATALDDSGRLINTAKLDTLVSEQLSQSKAQKSVAHYFGKTNVADLDTVENNYKPNKGIYGSAYAGYSSYFNASIINDGKVLTLMPLRKTEINEFALVEIVGSNPTPNAVIAAYAQRGLVAEYDDDVDLDTPSSAALRPSRVYYPLKTLIYDSCGLGWSDGSYVALEVRVTIVNGAPTLKNVGTPVTDSTGAHGREFTLNLAVGNSVTVNLYDIVSDPDIFTVGGNGLYSLATQVQFRDTAEGIARETGDYLDSPLKQTFPPYNPNNVTRVEVAPGEYKYYRNGGGFSQRGSTDRDVIMWMDLDRSSTESNPIPAGNSISFTVNRRTTSTYNDGHVTNNISINEYRFTVHFTDGQGESTQFFTFIINVTNQTPSITAVNRSFTMRAGDDLTVLTSYYDVFNGSSRNMQTAYSYSSTASSMQLRASDPSYISGKSGDGRNNETGDSYWKFGDITSSRVGDVFYDSTAPEYAGRRNLHLGYYALGDDDTPWRLRITHVDAAEDNHLWIDTQNTISLKEEGGTSNKNIAIHIRALTACVNLPVTITVSDGEGGVTTCTLYFTVISSPPIAIDCGNANQSVNLCEGLEGVMSNNAYIDGTFRLFTVPGKDGMYNIAGVGNHLAKRVYTINMINVALDPDGSAETNNMTLYHDGQFTVNGEPLVLGTDNVYSSDYFDIETINGGKAFRLTATGYNPDTSTGYEELKFRIADYGNSDYDNTLEITLRVYTTYSDVLNTSVGEKTDREFDAYLKGSEVVTVKSYDEYYVPETVPASRFAFMKLTDNIGNDGNTASPISDADVKKVNEKAYSAKLYAFINFDDDHNISALPSSTLSSMFDRNASGVFKLNGEDYSQFMIGGVSFDGDEIAIAETAKSRLDAIKRFVTFGFDGSGTSIVFTPEASTLGNKNILLYVEVEKYMGVRSAYMRTDAVYSAGALFRLDVRDSAPIAVSGSHAESGKAGDIVSFKIFDSNDKYSGLFVDSDNGDYVTVEPFTAETYESAMVGNNGIDWRADGDTPRAFDITISENNTLDIKINRRIDFIENGVYKPSVTFPIRIIGKDKVGMSVTTTVELTIMNSDITVGESTSDIDDETGVGYTFERSEGGEHTLDVSVRFSYPLDIDIFDFVRDADYTTAAADTDSYRFVNVGSDISPYPCLIDDAIKVKWYQTNDDGLPNADVSQEIATVTPLGEQTKRTGIRIEAFASVRSLTATMYMRVLDRAADASQNDAGVVIRVNITVMNDAPRTLPGMEAQTVYMMGSEKSDPTGMLFYIGDFVEDRNSSDVVGDDKSGSSDTYLRIFRQGTLPVNHLYSTVYSQVKEGSDDVSDVDSTMLFMVTVPDQLDEALVQAYCDARGLKYDYKDLTNKYKQWFVVTPIRGFFGDGAIDIAVSDGDLSTQYDTLTTTFRLNVHVMYDAREAENAMTEQTIACSKSQTLDIATLMPDLDNKLNYDNGDPDSTKFNQSKYYQITSIAFQDQNDASKATFTKVGDTATWTLKAGNQITIDPIRVNVRIAPISDPDNAVSKFFWLNIIPNQAPKMRYSEITFRKNHKDEPDALRDLNGNGVIKLQAWQLFDDPDDPQGNALRLISVKSQVPSLVKASLEKDETGENRFIVLKFVGCGESEITVGVTDETGNVVNLTFLARNDDLPEASLWVRLSASFEAHKVMWAVIIGCTVLIILILIIIIAVICKRKRAREELEALLVSEMEIEEQMLKLAGGPSPTDYHSYGYLQQPDGLGAQSMLEPGMNDITDNTMGALPPSPNDGTTPPNGDLPQ